MSEPADRSLKVRRGFALHGGAGHIARRALSDLSLRGQDVIVLGEGPRFERLRPHLEQDEAWRAARITYAPTVWSCLLQLLYEPPDLLAVAGAYEPHVSTLWRLVRDRCAVANVTPDCDPKLEDADFHPIPLDGGAVGTDWVASALALGAYRKARQRASPVTTHESSMPTHPHVLVVEDEEDKADFFARALDLLGYSCDVAHRGEEGLALFRARTPDVLWTNWGMPGLSGPTLIERIREEARGWIPCILESGYDARSLAAEAQRCGADLFRPSPFALRQISHLLERALELRQAFRFRLGSLPDGHPGPFAGEFQWDAYRALTSLLATEPRSADEGVFLVDFGFGSLSEWIEREGYTACDVRVGALVKGALQAFRSHGFLHGREGEHEFRAVLRAVRVNGSRPSLVGGQSLDSLFRSDGESFVSQCERPPEFGIHRVEITYEARYVPGNDRDLPE